MRTQIEAIDDAKDASCKLKEHTEIIDTQANHGQLTHRTASPPRRQQHLQHQHRCDLCSVSGGRCCACAYMRTQIEAIDDAKDSSCELKEHTKKFDTKANHGQLIHHTANPPRWQQHLHHRSRCKLSPVFGGRCCACDEQ